MSAFFSSTMNRRLTRLMQTYLARMGYTVDTSLRAWRRSALFEANPQVYKLVVADITLPDMAGNDMAVRMAERNPNLRILLCSGYPFAVDSLPEHIRDRVRVAAEAVSAEYARRSRRRIATSARLIELCAKTL